LMPTFMLPGSETFCRTSASYFPTCRFSRQRIRPMVAGSIGTELIRVLKRDGSTVKVISAPESI